MTGKARTAEDPSLLELFEVRRILEPAAAALAAARVAPPDVQELRELLGALGDSPTVDELVAHDQVFHRRIAELAGNAYLTSLLDTLSSSTLRARIWRGLSEEGSTERSLTEHRMIIRGDTALVAARATVHIDGVAGWLRRAIS